jgi:hypothetical protein
MIVVDGFDSSTYLLLKWLIAVFLCFSISLSCNSSLIPESSILSHVPVVPLGFPYSTTELTLTGKPSKGKGCRKVTFAVDLGQLDQLLLHGIAPTTGRMIVIVS